MLLGVDHIQFSVRDLHAATEFLSRAGYTSQFLASDFAQGQTPLPHFSQVRKRLVFLTGPGCAVELIDGGPHYAPLTYLAALPSSEEPMRWTTQELRAEPTASSAALHMRWVPELCAFASATPHEPIMTDIEVLTGDPASTTRFWAALGAKTGLNDHTLHFTGTAITRPLSITVRHIAGLGPRDVRVDDLGFTLVAITSTDLDADHRDLRAAGFPASEIFEVVVNERRLKICFTTGPNGELVELLQPSRAS